jgi:hypothetical protein
MKDRVPPYIEANEEVETLEARNKVNDALEGRSRELFGGCEEILEIRDGDRINAIRNRFTSQGENKMLADLSALSDFFDTVDHVELETDAKLEAFIHQKNPGLSEYTFNHLLCFTEVVQQRYLKSPRLPLKEQELKVHQRVLKGNYPSLHEALASNITLCMQLATLAQHSLQRAHIPSTLMLGSAVWKRTDETLQFATRHVFNVLREGKKTLIYDPANPLSYKEKHFPNIYVPTADFDAEIGKGQARLIRCASPFAAHEAYQNVYFGVQDDTNIKPGTFIG